MCCDRFLAPSVEGTSAKPISCMGVRTGDKKRRFWRRGFSLVELMVVIVIVGLLAGAATVAVRSYLIRGKQGVARMELSKICQAIDTFYAEYDRYPTNDEGLESLATPSEEFTDGLLSQLPDDPWGNPYEYLNPGREAPYEVICYGADGREGGEGADKDLLSTELDQR